MSAMFDTEVGNDVDREDDRRAVAMAFAVMDRIYAAQSWRKPIALRSDRWLTRWWVYVAGGWVVVCTCALVLFGRYMMQREGSPQLTAGIIDVDALGMASDHTFALEMPLDLHVASIADPIVLANVMTDDRIAHVEPVAFGMLVLIMLLGCWLFRLRHEV